MPRKSRADRAPHGRRVPPWSAALVPPARPRPSLAPDPRSLSHRGLGVHAAADPGLAGGGVLPPVPGAVSRHRRARRGTRRHGAGELGRTGLLPPRGQPAPAGAGRWSASTAGVIPADPVALAQLPGHGPLYRGRGGLFRLRAGGGGGGHQRGEGDPPGFPSRLRPTRRSGSGGRRSRSFRGKARAPGRSIRQSWSWAR